MILEVCWDGLWTLSFGLSQFRGHGSWLVCEVALGVNGPLGNPSTKRPRRIETGLLPTHSLPLSVKGAAQRGSPRAGQPSPTREGWKRNRARGREAKGRQREGRAKQSNAKQGRGSLATLARSLRS